MFFNTRDLVVVVLAEDCTVSALNGFVRSPDEENAGVGTIVKVDNCCNGRFVGVEIILGVYNCLHALLYSSSNSFISSISKRLTSAELPCSLCSAILVFKLSFKSTFSFLASVSVSFTFKRTASASSKSTNF